METQGFSLDRRLILGLLPCVCSRACLFLAEGTRHERERKSRNRHFPFSSGSNEAVVPGAPSASPFLTPSPASAIPVVGAPPPRL